MGVEELFKKQAEEYLSNLSAKQHNKMRQHNPKNRLRRREKIWIMQNTLNEEPLEEM